MPSPPIDARAPQCCASVVDSAAADPLAVNEPVPDAACTVLQHSTEVSAGRGPHHRVHQGRDRIVPPDVRRVRRLIPRNIQLRSTRRSEEHTSELQSLMRISYAVFCLKKKNNQVTIIS